ncbi:MAG TPA: hypothetical protein VFD20_06430 [Demequina sp.]|nr:hypothetical protein [Demequina sp.]
MNDVEERLIAGSNESVGEIVRVRIAPLAGNSIDRLDLIRTHFVAALACEPAGETPV